MAEQGVGNEQPDTAPRPMQGRRGGSGRVPNAQRSLNLGLGQAGRDLSGRAYASGNTSTYRRPVLPSRASLFSYPSPESRFKAAQTSMNSFLQRTAMLPARRGEPDLLSDRMSVMYNNASNIVKHDSRAFNPKWKGYQAYWDLHDSTTRMMREIRGQRFAWKPYQAAAARSTVYESNRWSRFNAFSQATARLDRFVRAFSASLEQIVRPLRQGLGAVAQPSGRLPPAAWLQQRAETFFRIGPEFRRLAQRARIGAFQRRVAVNRIQRVFRTPTFR